MTDEQLEKIIEAIRGNQPFRNMCCFTCGRSVTYKNPLKTVCNKHNITPLTPMSDICFDYIPLSKQ